MKMVSLRTLALSLGLAFAGLFATPQAQAGNKEILAIGNELGAATTDVNVALARIQAASDAALTQAVQDAFLDPANSRLNPATIASEALKNAVTATNIGTSLGTAIVADLTGPNGTQGLYPKITANVQSFVGKSSASAATGTTANATQIPTWAAEFIETVANVADRNAYTIATAKFALNSTTAIGALFGGRALLNDTSVDSDADLIALARQAIGDAKLAKAAQQIAQYVSDDADLVNVPAFAVGVADVLNFKHLAKVVTGTVTANPTQGSEVLDSMYAGDVVTSLLYLATVKNTSLLSKNLGLVADAEEVSVIAAEFGDRVGVVNPATGKVVGIKQSQINTIVKNLVTGLATRATGADAVGNSRTNRIDESGEVGAYMINALNGLPDFQGKDNAGNTLTGSKLKAATNRSVGIFTSMLKTAIKAALKVHRDIATVVPTNPRVTTTKDTLYQATVADDISGSVAQTLRELGAGAFGPGIYDAIVAALTKPTAGKSIAGGSPATFDIGDGPETIAQIVQTALASGLNNTNNASNIYEHGTMPQFAQGGVPETGNVTDRETDFFNR